MGIEFKTDAAQVQAVGIVASIYGRIARRMFLCMELAGMVKLFELFLRDVEKFFLEALLGKFRPALAMFAVVTVIFALAVVEECEQAHHRDVRMSDLRKAHPVELHLPPMRKTVDVRIEHPVAKDEIL